MKYKIGSEWFKKLLEKGILKCTPKDLYEITGCKIQPDTKIAELIDPDSFNIYKETNGNDDYYVFYNELYNNIGVDSLSFKMDDLYADIDAL